MHILYLSDKSTKYKKERKTWKEPVLDIVNRVAGRTEASPSRKMFRNEFMSLWFLCTLLGQRKSIDLDCIPNVESHAGVDDRRAYGLGECVAMYTLMNTMLFAG